VVQRRVPADDEHVEPVRRPRDDLGLAGAEAAGSGGGGEREFRLRSRAGSPGTVQVTLARSRRWESAPLEVRTLEVRVE
jgi:hypothetical protein